MDDIPAARRLIDEYATLCDIKAADFLAREYVARVEQAADLADQDRDATMMWLRHSLVPAVERQRMAATIMTGSVYAQAGLLGLVDCTRCGDLGCGWCR